MPTINDYKKRALNNFGYSGDINTAESKWLKAICSPYVGAIPDMWRYALRQVGFTGGLLEMQNEFLKELGYTDFSISNRWYKYWKNGTVPAWGLEGSVLDIDFANSRAYNSDSPFKTTPDQILTYTAPSPKMVYGDDGVLRYAPHNLFRRSNEFDSVSWTATSATLIASQQAPDGSNTAYKLIGSVSAATSHRISQNITSRANVVHKAQIRAKAGEKNFLTFGDAVASVAYWNLSTGTVAGVSGPATASIASLGDGWYLCSIEFTPNITALGPSWYVSETGVSASWAGDGVSGIYIWRSELSLAPAHTGYIPTTSAAVYSLPIDHDPVTHEALGVLIEEQRTNLLTYSEQFNNAAWGKVTSAISANASAAPDGATSADKLVGTAGSTNIRLQQAVSLTGAVTYTYSIYAKADEYSTLRVQRQDTNLNAFTHDFDLSAGTVSGGGVIQSAGNGWYRCSGVVTCNTTASTGVLFVAEPGATGDATSGLYLWGAQLEAGAFPTSYIPTVASQVTRAADQVSILTSAFGFNASEGTLTVAGDVQGANAIDNRLAIIANASASERSIDVNRTTSTSRISSSTIVSAVATANISPTATNTVGQLMKIAGAYKQDDFGVCLDGGGVATDTSGAVPAPGAATALYLGRFPADIRYLNGHIKRLTYFPTRKSNTELQALTA